MKQKKSRAVIALALCLATAISLMSLGFAAWHTEITASGNVAASGNWDVSITDAGLNLSTGASATTQALQLQRTGVKSDALIAATISSGTWLSADNAALAGTQSADAMSKYTYYYAVDTTKYDVSSLTTITKDLRNEMAQDETTVVISDHLNMYYRYVTGGVDGMTPGTADYSSYSSALVVDGLLADTQALLKQMYPDTWQNYALCSLSASLMKSNYVIASFNTVTIPADENTMVTCTATEAVYADVTFSLPDAWAEYSITITNNGTADANLADAVIELESASEQLKLSKPDLTDEVLKSGESCTITVVVQALDDGTDTLDATGTLTIRLPYSQTAVEAAPEASHTH